MAENTKKILPDLSQRLAALEAENAALKAAAANAGSKFRFYDGEYTSTKGKTKGQVVKTKNVSGDFWPDMSFNEKKKEALKAVWTEFSAWVQG